jgi:hypothetical protein
MKNNKVFLLNFTTEKIEKGVKIGYDFWYIDCIEKIKGIELCKLPEKGADVIGNFLFKWGRMRRVGTKEECTKAVIQVLCEKCSKLQNLRELYLEEEDINNYKEYIKKYYEVLAEKSPVLAAKVLHLICPNFFPAWDRNIILKFNNNDDSKEGYYKFMLTIQEFVKNKNCILSKLSKEHKESKLRIADVFMWSVANYKEIK